MVKQSEDVARHSSKLSQHAVASLAKLVPITTAIKQFSQLLGDYAISALDLVHALTV